MRASIDPGLGGTGYALWDRKTWAECVKPYEVGIWTPKDGTGSEWVARSFAITDAMGQCLTKNSVTHLYCEWPQMFDSGMGHKVASGKVSDLGKLTFLVGAIAGMCREREVQFIPVPVNDWKGQLPKDTVTRRLIKRLDLVGNEYDSHMWDAIGIGLYKKGFFRHEHSTS